MLLKSIQFLKRKYLCFIFKLKNTFTGCRIEVNRFFFSLLYKCCSTVCCPFCFWWKVISRVFPVHNVRLFLWLLSILPIYICFLPVFLPGKSHGQRILVGYSPWGHKELDMTEHTQTHTHTHSDCIKKKETSSQWSTEQY